MKYEMILYEKKEKILYVTLNRTNMLNAVSDTVHAEVVQAFKDFDADPELEVALLLGNGHHFSSGADVRQRQLRPREELIRLGGPGGVKPVGGVLGLGDCVNWKPVIAATHGYTLGIGFGFATECDLLVAAEDTKFQVTEVSRGIAGARAIAKIWLAGGGIFSNEIALTCRYFSAEEAYRVGIVNYVPKLAIADSSQIGNSFRL